LFPSQSTMFVPSLSWQMFGFLNNIKRLQKALPAPPKTVSAAELASSRSNPPLTAKAAASGSVLAYLHAQRKNNMS
jgi:hypothetical protein